MTAACPIMSPEQRRYAEIKAEAEAVLLARVEAALDGAQAAMTAGLAAAGHAEPAPARGFFAAVVHQALYCQLCGADPHTFEGGDPAVALGVIRNAKNVARHYWGADIAPDPAPVRAKRGPPPAA